MSLSDLSRRRFLSGSAALAGMGIAGPKDWGSGLARRTFLAAQEEKTADYTLRIKASPIEIAPKRIVSAVTYNGQFPGPLLRVKESNPVTVDIYNDTDTPEQLHWHGQ